MVGGYNMISLRKAVDRGQSQIEWLNSYHSFSFADYYDEDWMSFGPLRVINEDYIQPGRGFDKHPHQDMEIITYVVSGSLTHQDSMGNGSVISPGEIQRMSAGRGIRHSEFNHSNIEALHLLQIWILPEKKGIDPGYEQKKIAKKPNQLILVGSNHPTEQAVTIHQNVQIFVGFFETDTTIVHALNHRHAWLQLIKGRIQVNKQLLSAGDGVGLRDETELSIECIEESEFLLFDMI
jgi:redox-sensitive bicupin YhaK (pirin superfamily)